MRPNRQSLSNKSPSATTGPRHLRIWIQGKAHTKQKEIGISHIPLKFLYLHGLLTIVSPTTVFLDGSPRSSGGCFSFVPRWPVPQQLLAQTPAAFRVSAAQTVPGHFKFTPAVAPYTPTDVAASLHAASGKNYQPAITISGFHLFSSCIFF